MLSPTINERGIRSTLKGSPWLDRDREHSLAPSRMFCLPYVGGGAWIYRGWSDCGGKEVEVIPIALPGRDKRLLEKPYSDLFLLVRALADVLPLDKPFTLFGHSMGALIAFELATELQRRDSRLPFCLFASGCGAPQVPRRNPLRHLLSDVALVAELRDLGGTPDEVLRDSGLMELFLPTIRADFAIVETYEYTQSNSLGCPIVVLHGDEDRETTRDDALAWRLRTSNTFRMETFHGDHFFLHAAKQSIVRLITNEVLHLRIAR
jgi:surfactin synthase thioesterase subunit